MSKTSFSILFGLTVFLHFLLLIFEVIAFFILPFATCWYIALPIMTFLVTLVFSRQECPITSLENFFRRKLGKKEIGGFLSYYIVKPIRNTLK